MRRALLKGSVVAALLSGGVWPGDDAPLAGAWTRQPGHAYFKLDERYQRSDRFRTSDGETVGIPTVTDYTTSLYAEYGFAPRVTGVLYLPFFRRITLNEQVGRPGGFVFFEGDSRSGFSDAEAGVRIGLIRGGPTVLSAGLTLGIPLGELDRQSGLNTGDGEYNQRLSILVGHSFSRAGVYLSAETGFDNRTRGYSDELRWSGEVGGRVGRLVELRVRARGVRSLENGEEEFTGGTSGLFANNQSYVIFGSELSVRCTRSFGVVLSAEDLLWGENVLDDPAFSVGLVWEHQ